LQQSRYTQLEETFNWDMVKWYYTAQQTDMYNSRQISSQKQVRLGGWDVDTCRTVTIFQKS